ncbi:MAG: D-2-hydroxyacid dehydrogenase [Sporomusaceae bacterium]|nr:D-2-hydroxyacid dehydrogenase [Sporomusaceae bacterium]
MKILVLNPLSDDQKAEIAAIDSSIEVVTSTLPEAHLEIADTDILVAWGFMHIEELFAKAPNLKWIHALSAGVENLNLPELKEKQVFLTNSKGIHGIPVSEHVFAMMLSFSRGLYLSRHKQQEHRWKRVPTDELYEKTIGIVGLGSIGREIAKKAKCFGMNVVATKREMTTEIFVDRLYHPDEIFEMLSHCDYVVAALPLIAETENFFSQKHFDAMKQTAYFINIARGPVVVEQDLIAALQEGVIQGAGLDVFPVEPLPSDSPLWDMENVIITPHVAALSPYYLDRAIKLFADNLSRFIAKGELCNQIDPIKGY